MIFKKVIYKESKFKMINYFKTKKEITNLVKSQNLIDVRTPSFINVKLILIKK